MRILLPVFEQITFDAAIRPQSNQKGPAPRLKGSERKGTKRNRGARSAAVLSGHDRRANTLIRKSNNLLLTRDRQPTFVDEDRFQEAEAVRSRRYSRNIANNYRMAA